jgi:chromosome segregation ATPase
VDRQQSPNRRKEEGGKIIALQETAQKAYARYGGDLEKTYTSRRFSIRQQLPHMTASQLQKRLNDLDEEIADLKNENAQFKRWIRQIRREGNASAYLDYVHRTLTKSHLGTLELRLDANKTALEWMQRERRIYAWALRLRKIKSVKVPFLKQRRASLEKRACELEGEIKAAEAKLRALRGDHEKVQCELWGVNREIELLSV